MNGLYNMNETIKVINDYSIMKDTLDEKIIHEMSKDNRNKKNKLAIYDINGNVIGEYYNKVVAKGRVETIENLFRRYDISDKNGWSYTIPQDNRWISVFGFGSGGAPASEGMNPFIVDADSTELSNQLQFRKNFVNVNTQIYWDNGYKKDFTKILLNWDKEADNVYALLMCEFDLNDALGCRINEIGLYSCEHTLNRDGIATDKRNFSLYAKANMNTINKSPLENTAAFNIAYKVFI